MDASTPGVQSSLSVPGPQDIDIGIVLGDDAGKLIVTSGGSERTDVDTRQCVRACAARSRGRAEARPLAV